MPAVADHGIAPSGWVVAPEDGWVAPRGRTPDGRAVATPGSRLLAFLIDGVIWLVPQVLAFLALVFVLSYLSEASGSASEEEVAFFFLVPLLVFAIGMLRLAVEAEKVARRGQTWGMRALQLRAVDARNGGSLTRSRAWGRAAFATWFSTQLLGFGYWWAFFDDRNRCLHDIVCTTVVVDERWPPPPPGRAPQPPAPPPKRRTGLILGLLAGALVLLLLLLIGGGVIFVATNTDEETQGPVPTTTADNRSDHRPGAAQHRAGAAGHARGQGTGAQDRLRP